jgi:hypothetical protein
MKDVIPDNDKHLRPEGVSDETVAGVGKLTEALEKLERARGALYDVHQIVGGVDEQVSEAADMLEKAGHSEQASMLREQIVGMNVLPGRWTFQIVEEFDDGYYTAVKQAEKDVREQLVSGRRHIYESELKERNRTKGFPGHEARP